MEDLLQDPSTHEAFGIIFANLLGNNLFLQSTNKNPFIEIKVSFIGYLKIDI